VPHGWEVAMKKENAVKMIVVVLSLAGVLAGCAGPRENVLILPDENAQIVTFPPEREPDGFAGMKWGTEISALNGMLHYRFDQSHGGIEFYIRQSEPFTLGKARLDTVQYGFWSGKFYVGMVTTNGLSNWDAIKRAVFEKYGPGAKPFINKEDYVWFGDDAIMALRYDEESKSGVFYIRSDALKRQMESKK
jgi:hypothetical protein